VARMLRGGLHDRGADGGAVVIVLLVVELALGLMSRPRPSLNILAPGLPGPAGGRAARARGPRSRDPGRHRVRDPATAGARRAHGRVFSLIARAEMSEDRTEKPTSRRLRDARRKGRSRAAGGGAVPSWWPSLAVFRVGGAVLRGGPRAPCAPDWSAWESRRGGARGGELARLAQPGGGDDRALVGPWHSPRPPPHAGGRPAGRLERRARGADPRLDAAQPSHGLRRLSPSRVGPDLLKTLIALTVITWISTRLGARHAGSLGEPRTDDARARAHRRLVTGRAPVRQAAIGLAVIAARLLLQRWRLDDPCA